MNTFEKWMIRIILAWMIFLTILFAVGAGAMLFHTYYGNLQ